MDATTLHNLRLAMDEDGADDWDHWPYCYNQYEADEYHHDIFEEPEHWTWWKLTHLPEDDELFCGD